MGVVSWYHNTPIGFYVMILTIGYYYRERFVFQFEWHDLFNKFKGYPTTIPTVLFSGYGE